MKLNIILIILTNVIGLTCYGQSYIATPSGLVDKSNPEHSYLVLEFEGMSVKELYAKSYEFVVKHYKNPDEVLKGDLKNEYLRFKTYSPDILYIMNMGIKQFFSATYSVELRFKEGKVRYEIIDLHMNHVENNMELYFSGSGLQWRVFNGKNGKLKFPEAKIDIESFFNSNVAQLVEFIKRGDQKNDDW